MEKYTAVIDYKASGSGLKPQVLEAQTIIEAMNEAEELLDENVYMITIIAKDGKTSTQGRVKKTEYVTVLANRGSGWHAADEKHYERATRWNRYEIGISAWYEIA